MRDGNHKEMDLSDRSSAARKRRERDRMRGAGFKVMQFWVHAKDAALVKKQVAKLRAKRMPADDEGEST